MGKGDNTVSAAGAELRVDGCGSNNLLSFCAGEWHDALARNHSIDHSQPNAYTAEDKLQGKRKVTRGKDKCEQREGDEVMGMCRQREEGAAAKAASREEEATFCDLNTPNNMEYLQPWHPRGSRLLEMKTWRQHCALSFLGG